MEKNLIMFNSMTFLMKAKELLRRNNIYANTIRTPARLRQRSCGYSLQVNNDFDRAFELIKENNIPIIGVSAVDYK